MRIRPIYITLIALLISSTLFSQGDTLLELGGNNSLSKFYNTHKDDPNSPYNRSQLQNKKTALSLPFIDDFSQNYIYPNGNLWEDINVYINSSFPDFPITYGVATFDGLDATGTPYNFANPNAYGPADTLTSKQIDLSNSIDSVYFSFYYQPQGNGNKPEVKDSLRLEFLDTSGTWVRMWGAPGTSNHPFKRVMIPVDSSFQNSVFQFRFMNWATLSGNVDHWHIDYAYLNDNRTFSDTILNDVSFITNHFSLLNKLTAMPWSHYLTDTTSFMVPFLPVTYRNNDNQAHNVYFKLHVIDNNGAGPEADAPYPPGIPNYNVPAFTDISVDIAIGNNLNDFYYPVDDSSFKVFQINNYFNLPIPDSNIENDTVRSYQVFNDYYAYDDGSAEQGYGVQGIGSKLAHEFDIKKSDTLTAFRIYFNPIVNNLNAESFRLKVWSSLNPEIEVYSQTATQFTNPIYSSTNTYLDYALNQPLYLTAGTYYFGWEKITANFLNVGWDVNTNNRNKVHINYSGLWQNPSASSIPDGSLMLRPVFRNLPPVVVSAKEETTDAADFKVYPNPTKDHIYFKISNPSPHLYAIELIDIYGKVILQTESKLNNKLNVSGVSSGLYIVRFTNEQDQQSILKKIIISK